jgi:glutamate/tyrosine decarboxylase-like PLP-dependent enzyme
MISKVVVQSEESSRDPFAAPSAVLFPRPEEREWFENFLTRELIGANARVRRGSVVPTQNLEQFKRELAEFNFSKPRPLEQLLTWSIAQMENGIVHMNHPRYFGLFNPAPTLPAQFADRIAGSFNPQLATRTTSPAAVEIEAHVIRTIARRAGLPIESGGHFTSSGSEANLTALICALTHLEPKYSSDGLRAYDGQPIFYVSRDSHLGWLKIAHIAGLGRSAVRLIETDGSGRMSIAALAKALKADRLAGCVPIMIAATAGTTNAGMVDPLFECANVARDHGMWYHVDAAWGGALIASDRLRHVLAGIEQADSITIDAHKWFATTMGCGMFITKYPQVLSSAFQVSTSFMPSNLATIDPFMTTVQWSRRFLGLRLFLSLAAIGWQGYANHVERTVELCEVLRSKLVKRGWSIANKSRMAVLCVKPSPGSSDTRSIVNRVLSTGRAWVANAMFEGENTIRLCITNGETTERDVTELIEVLSDASSER